MKRPKQKSNKAQTAKIQHLKRAKTEPEQYYDFSISRKNKYVFFRNNIYKSPTQNSISHTVHSHPSKTVNGRIYIFSPTVLLPVTNILSKFARHLQYNAIH